MTVVPSSISSDRILRWTLRVAVAILVLGVAAYLIQGAGTTVRPKVETNGATPSRIAGFDQIAFAVRGANGATVHQCGLLALTRAQQELGLMNRRDLAGYDGMVFQFVDPSTDQFYMKDTLIALSIAWFDAAGRFVSATDMTPCGSTAVCPLYRAARPYSFALEVPEGQLGHAGAGPGSTLSVGGPC